MCQCHSPVGIGRTTSRGHSRCALRWFVSPHPGPTPALSLGERVTQSPRGEQSSPLGSPLRDARCFLSLGERIKVRGNGASYSRISGPFLELSNWTSPPAEPEVT